MNALIPQMQRLFGPNAKAVRALMAPLVVVMILAMMVLPLPPFALDLLFTFNIAMALMVMMVAAYMTRPLDFAAFPAVILLTTLLRLSLNVASTRVVLLEGHTGAAAAGKVIESFGHFLIGGNFAVGLIVFAILVVINFVVVTKGAERIAFAFGPSRRCICWISAFMGRSGLGLVRGRRQAGRWCGSSSTGTSIAGSSPGSAPPWRSAARSW